MGEKQQPSSTEAFAQSVAAKILVVALNAATGILTARALAPQGRGELSAMMLWYILLSSSLTLGLPSAVTYQLRMNPDRKSEFTGAAVLLSLLISSIAAIIGYFLLPFWIPQYSPDVLFFARLFLLNTPVAAFLVIGRASVESSGAFRPSNLSTIGPPLLTLVGLLLLKLTGSFTAVHAAWCYILSGIPSLLLILHAVQSTFRPNVHNVLRSARHLMSYGIRSYGIDLCGTMSLYVDQAFVVRFLPPDAMGIYVVALSLSRILNVFHTSVVMVLFPKAVSRTPLEVLDMTGRAVRMTTAITAIFGAAIVIAGPGLLVLLYGSEYKGATSILRILVLEVVISGATQVMSQAFMALARPGVVTSLQAFGLMLTIPLMLLLIPRFGLEGAATALLLSTCARFAFVIASFPVFLRLPIPGLLLRREEVFHMAVTFNRFWRLLQPKEVESHL
jgi:O-antigen/teichoic acid export membrane protein